LKNILLPRASLKEEYAPLASWLVGWLAASFKAVESISAGIPASEGRTHHLHSTSEK
jgi:hypothetical protein